MTPVRVQLKRSRGWKMPPNTVKVCRPTKWGNPFRVGTSRPSDCNTRKEATDEFYVWLMDAGGKSLLDDLNEIRGKNLACWCPLTDKDGNRVPCHADVLLEIANSPAP